MRDGYVEDWNEGTAAVLAEKEGIELTDKHLEIIKFARDFFDEYSVDPSIPDLVRNLFVKEEDILTLFPGGLEQVAKLAGISHTPCV